MAKKKVKRAARKSSSKGLFEMHPNLRWLLPLFVVVVALYFLLYI